MHYLVGSRYNGKGFFPKSIKFSFKINIYIFFLVRLLVSLKVCMCLKSCMTSVPVSSQVTKRDWLRNIFMSLSLMQKMWQSCRTHWRRGRLKLFFKTYFCMFQLQYFKIKNRNSKFRLAAEILQAHNKPHVSVSSPLSDIFTI